uniref:Uncharacterized protein n=1 Tax=Oryza punctata TaxID=4537 RepID=A0A0E0JQ44_ORYPU
MALGQEELSHLLVVRMLELKACSHLGVPSVHPLDPGQSNEHLRLVLVRGLDCDADDSFLESVFLPFADGEALHDKISEPTTASTSISSRTSFRSIFQTSSAIASPRNRPLEMNVELSEPEKQLACAGTASTSSEISEEEAPQDTIAEPTTTSARIDPRTDLRRGNTQKLMFSLNAKTSLEEAASIHAILEENGIFLESVFFPLRNVEVSGTEKRSARAGTTSTCSDIREEEAAQDKIAEPVMSLATMDPRIALRRGSDQKLASVNLRTALKEAASHAHLIVNDPSNHWLSHVMLFVLSKKLPRSEGKEGKEKAANLSKDRIIWAIQKIVVPVPLCFIMSLLRVYVISAEEIQDELQSVSIQHEVEDSVIWKLTANGECAVSSAYNLLFMTTVKCPFGESIWKTREVLPLARCEGQMSDGGQFKQARMASRTYMPSLPV